MKPNHGRYFRATDDKKKARVQLFSKADRGILNRVCAPMDYGPGTKLIDALNRYWLWDYDSNAGSKTLGLAEQQIVDLGVLSKVLESSQLGRTDSAMVHSTQLGLATAIYKFAHRYGRGERRPPPCFCPSNPIYLNRNSPRAPTNQ